MANATEVNAKTFAQPPFMGGDNITSGTIAAAAVSGTAALLSTSQTFSGAKTFTLSVIESAAAINNAAKAAVFEVTESAPERGSGYKRVVLYCDNTSGDTIVSFPTAFLHTPVIRTTNSLSAGIVTGLSTSGCTVTGVGNTGFLIIEGF